MREKAGSKKKERELDAKLEAAKATANKARVDSKANADNAGPLNGNDPIGPARGARGSLYPTQQHRVGTGRLLDPGVHDRPAIPPRNPARGGKAPALRSSDGNVGASPHASDIALPSSADIAPPNPGHDALDAVRNLSVPRRSVGSPVTTRRESEADDVPARLPPRQTWPGWLGWV